MAKNELAIITADHPVVTALVTPGGTALLNKYLGDSGLTAEDLYTDMASAMTLKPQLARCDPSTLFHCLLFAAKHRASFGMYGVELVPRMVEEDDGDKKVKKNTAVPQLGYRYKVDAAKKSGVVNYHVERVYEGEKFEVITDGGMPVSVQHTIDWSKPRPTGKGKLLATYGIAEFADGKRVYKILSRADIDRSENRRATKGPGVWGSDYDRMVDKTTLHRTMEHVVGNFTYGMGTAGGPPASEYGYEEEAFEIEAERTDPSAKVAGELEGRSADLDWPEDVPEGMHHAAALYRGFEACDDIATYWEGHGKGLVRLAGKDEQEFMVSMKDRFKAADTPTPEPDPEPVLTPSPPVRPGVSPAIAESVVSAGVMSEALRCYHEAYQALESDEKAVHNVNAKHYDQWLQRANEQEKGMLRELAALMLAPVAQWLKDKAESTA